MHNRFFFVAGVLLFILSTTSLLIFKEAATGKATTPLLLGQAGEAPLPITSTGTTTYVYGSRLIVKKDTTVTYHFQDLIGTNSITTNNAGQIREKITTYPYGKKAEEALFSENKQKYVFTGKERDSSLDYFGARYYDPRLGRFISTDPIMTPTSAYVYASDNPLVRTDPTGKADVYTYNTQKAAQNAVKKINEENSATLPYKIIVAKSLLSSRDSAIVDNGLGDLFPTGVKGTLDKGTTGPPGLFGIPQKGFDLPKNWAATDIEVVETPKDVLKAIKGGNIYDDTPGKRYAGIVLVLTPEIVPSSREINEIYAVKDKWNGGNTFFSAWFVKGDKSTYEFTDQGISDAFMGLAERVNPDGQNIVTFLPVAKEPKNLKQTVQPTTKSTIPLE
ncbi:MAG: RHS repeat-associated core domain-containing protein [Nanoarchaeota archaeon]